MYLNWQLYIQNNNNNNNTKPSVIFLSISQCKSTTKLHLDNEDYNSEAAALIDKKNGLKLKHV